MEKFLTFIGAVVGFVALIFFSAMWSGYVLTILWGWFIVPVFKLPVLSIPVAIGMALTISYLTKSSGSMRKKENDDTWYESAFMGFFKPLVVLFIGWMSLTSFD